ncbi:MAG: SDR family NAD(P)-dependent oxidoreductase [Culicoidibacterales bacterium]
MKLKFPEQIIFIKNDRAIQKKSTVSIKGQTCVITGATSGVGYQAARALAAGGGNLVIIARNQQKAEAVKAEFEGKYAVTVDYVLADLADLRQVQEAAHVILAQYQRIDVLVNSAGIYSTKKVYNHDGLELVFCVNHLATLLLTQILLPRMIESAPARIIQVNSEGHRFNGLNVDDLNWQKRKYTGLRSYGASKTAQLFTVWQLAAQLQGTGVTINAMHPGAVKSNIGENNGKLYRWFLHHVTWQFLKEPEIAGDAIYYLATAPELSAVNGKFFNLTIEELPAKHARNPKNQQLIWEKSLELIGKSTGISYVEGK